VGEGKQTKQQILESGLEMASRLGLECVTIGALAKASEMSKSGLFAHFQSKERLQIEILAHAAEAFAASVIRPALKAPRGVPRIRALVRHWVRWTERLSGGCIFVSASAEYTDRPGPVREVLLRQQHEWIDCLRRIAGSAVQSGDFRADADCDQFAFEIYSLLLGFHVYRELLDDADTVRRQQAALERLLEAYR
jgi:AcrR family transcriptional regulator